MYMDHYSARVEVEARMQELRRSYADAQYDQQWVTTKVGQALKAVGEQLTVWGNALQLRREEQAPATIPVTGMPRRR